MYLSQDLVHDKRWQQENDVDRALLMGIRWGKVKVTEVETRHCQLIRRFALLGALDQSHREVPFGHLPTD